MFASKGIAEHLGRGLAGIAALACAAHFAPSHPWWSLAFIPVALVALRGCPMCWTLGLIETVLATIQRKPSAGSCTDGSCALRVSPDRGPAPAGHSGKHRPDVDPSANPAPREAELEAAPEGRRSRGRSAEPRPGVLPSRPAAFVQ